MLAARCAGTKHAPAAIPTSNKCYKNKRGRICRLDAEEQSAHQMAVLYYSGDAQRESNNNEYHSLTQDHP